jgi:hypothetical protein
MRRRAAASDLDTPICESEKLEPLACVFSRILEGVLIGRALPCRCFAEKSAKRRGNVTYKRSMIRKRQATSIRPRSAITAQKTQGRQTSAPAVLLLHNKGNHPAVCEAECWVEQIFYPKKQKTPI